MEAETGNKLSRAAPKIRVTPPGRSPGKLIHDADALLSAALVRRLHGAGYDLSSEAWGILCLLWEDDNLPQSEIGEQLGKDRHHVSRLIDTLEKQGLVARNSKDEDRRIKRISLTNAGRAARSKLIPVASDFIERTFEGITLAEYDCFMRCLRHIVSRLQADKEQGGGLVQGGGEPWAPPQGIDNRDQLACLAEEE